jgi:hypothetical protein
MFFPAILGIITGTVLFFSYDDKEKEDNNFVGPIPPTPPDNLIDINLPFGIGDIEIDNKVLLIPILWIAFKYKPWK